MHLKRLNFQTLFYGAFLILFCTKRFWGADVPWYYSLITRLAGLVLLVLMRQLVIKVPKLIKKNFMLATIPQLVIILYSLLLWLFQWSNVRWNVVVNLFTSNIYIIISVLFASAVYMIFGKNSISFFLKCAFISYLCGSVAAILFRFGLKNTLICLLTSVPPVHGMGYIMEVHDLTLAMGAVFLYYLFFAEKNKRRTYDLILCGLLIFWGLKRIEIGALIVCCICYYLLVKKFGLRKAINIIGVCTLVVCYTYIMLIHTGALAELADELHINFMGRLPTYSYVTENYSRFSLTFPGIGVGYIDEILDFLVSTGFRVGYTPVISLHSDVLRMYIGLGFIGFGVWGCYQLFFRPRIMMKHFPSKTVCIYVLLTLYSFILYLTDNTYSYPITYFAINLAILNTLDGSDTYRSKNTPVEKVL